jgi:hypothetical protein
VLAEILKNEFYTVMVSGSDRRVELARSAVPFESRTQLLTTAEAIFAAVKKAGANDFALVIDSRLAPAAQEGKYKDAFFTMARMLTSRFSPVAVVLTSEEAIARTKPNARPEVTFFTDMAQARNAVSKR